MRRSKSRWLGLVRGSVDAGPSRQQYLFQCPDSKRGPPARIVYFWWTAAFNFLPATNRSTRYVRPRRNLKFSKILQPHDVGVMVNNLYRATVWPGPIPRKHQAADPADSFLLDLIEAAQPDYAVTGDKRVGLLELDKLGRTKILKASVFCAEVLHL